MPHHDDHSAPEHVILALLMDILRCSERHARSIYIYHVDAPGPASLADDHGEATPTLPHHLPELTSESWLTSS